MFRNQSVADKSIAYRWEILRCVELDGECKAIGGRERTPSAIAGVWRNGGPGVNRIQHPIGLVAQYLSVGLT